MFRPWQQLKNIYHLFRAHGWRIWYGRPDKKLKVYGVTGTNGKTTTCYLLASIFGEEWGEDRVGMLTTVEFRVGKNKEFNETKMTTLPSRLMFKKLKEMVEVGVRQVIIEVTSHALDQNRLAGIRLAGAIILNVEREHLDYHGTMKEYVRAKGRIDRYLVKHAPLVVGEKFSVFNFQFLKGRIIKFVTEEAVGTETPLGDWARENVLAAKLLAKEVGVKEENIERGAVKMKSVPGRMEWGSRRREIQNSKFKEQKYSGPRVLIDYAVTAGALERLYKNVRENTGGKIFAVLGAAGERDRGKRPEMVRAVAKYADETVLTREDPWTEDEEQIFRDLEGGLDREVEWRRIVDREEAIRYCLEKAGPDDVVVITGKGAETGMGVGKKIVPWSDKKVVLSILKEFYGQDSIFNN